MPGRFSLTVELLVLPFQDRTQQRPSLAEQAAPIAVQGALTIQMT
ncbi:MAG: hypothetical protein ACXW39_00525 [Nitrospira sp.]